MMLARISRISLEISTDFVEKYDIPPFQGRISNSAVKIGRKSCRRDEEDHMRQAPESAFTEAGSERREGQEYC